VVKIVAIVEGHGEVEAVPILVRRIAAVVAPTVQVEIPKPIRMPRHGLVKEGELERAIELAARQSGDDGRILVLLDADEDCPRDLGLQLLGRACRARPDRRIRVVLPKVEYETWFLAAARSLAGKRGISVDVTAPSDPESIRDAKRWLSEHRPSGRPYRPSIDQPALTAVFDLESARSASSFNKMWRDVISLL
jgi:hypothetical protein